MAILTRSFLIYLCIACMVVPVESFLDSLDFSSHRKQIMDVDDENYSIAIPATFHRELESKGSFFSNNLVHSPFILPFVSLFVVIVILLSNSNLLAYNLLYLPPPKLS